MKINIITSPFGELPPNAFGAVEKLFYQLAGAWATGGHSVCFICAGGGENSQIKYVRIGKYKRTGRTITDLPIDLWYSLKAIFAMPKCDVLVCNTFWSPVFAPLMRWKYKKLIYGVHRYPKKQFFLYPFVHKFICVSSAVAEPLKKQGDSSRICVIPNPIDTDIFKLGSRQIVQGRVLYAGRIHPLKGLRCLASACGQLFEEGIVKELVLVGPWETEKGGGGENFIKELKILAGNCPVEQTGALTNPVMLADIERTANVFVYPSEDIIGESFGIAPLEAMSLGVPTIVSDLACFNEFVHNGENALKFAINQVNDLVLKMRTLMMNEELIRTISIHSGEVALHFSVSNISAKYIEIFSQTMECI